MNDRKNGRLIKKTSNIGNRPRLRLFNADPSQRGGALRIEMFPNEAKYEDWKGQVMFSLMNVYEEGTSNQKVDTEMALKFRLNFGGVCRFIQCLKGAYQNRKCKFDIRKKHDEICMTVRKRDDGKVEIEASSPSWNKGEMYGITLSESDAYGLECLLTSCLITVSGI